MRSARSAGGVQDQRQEEAVRERRHLRWRLYLFYGRRLRWDLWRRFDLDLRRDRSRRFRRRWRDRGGCISRRCNRQVPYDLWQIEPER